MDSTFDDEETIVGNQFGQPQRRIDVDLERFQVTIIHADDTGACLESFAQLSLIVHFNENVQPDFCCEVMQVFELGRFQHRRNKKDSAGSRTARFVNLEFVENEILA